MARRRGKSPSSRTLDECRKRGWIAQVVEQRVPHSFRTRDLFGVIDIIAVTPDGIVGIQATGGSNNHGPRRTKILAESRMRQWLGAGARLELWSWSKRGPRGQRKLWTLRAEEFHAADFATGTAR